MDGGGFEPPKQFAADLQSVPFGHSGIHPCRAYALTMWNCITYLHKLQALNLSLYSDSAIFDVISAPEMFVSFISYDEIDENSSIDGIINALEKDKYICTIE